MKMIELLVIIYQYQYDKTIGGAYFIHFLSQHYPGESRGMIHHQWD